MTQSGRMPDTHAEAWALLPFLANGRITPEDREWVEVHLQSCAECRRELAEQQPLANEMRHAEAPFANSEQRAFAKLWTRIEAAEGAVPTDTAAAQASVHQGAQRRTVRWLAAAVVVQALGLALLGVTALNNSESASADFRTVTSPDVRRSRATVRLVFAPDTSVAAVTDILTRHHLELVAGPGGAGVFTAALVDGKEGASVESVVTALRQDVHVRFAEPLGD